MKRDILNALLCGAVACLVVILGEVVLGVKF